MFYVLKQGLVAPAYSVTQYTCNGWCSRRLLPRDGERKTPCKTNIQVTTLQDFSHFSLLSIETRTLAIIHGGGGAIRPLPRDGGAGELHGNPTVGPSPNV